ncbi:hypothetical protein SESBI_34848 [Sesbania bispinosa]|nr:hypothetical protein SESBI_34848 [Sesbania bispinosa]
MAIALPAISADHSPNIFWLRPKESSGKSFKYEAMWEEHSESANVIRKAWNHENQGEDYWDRLAKKTRRSTFNLRSWHKKTFKRADSNGDWVEGHRELSTAIMQHFQYIYSVEQGQQLHECLQHTLRLVNEDMNRDLLRTVTEKDIQGAVFDIGALKAPGPDGYNGLFYHKHWDTVKKDVIDVILDFFCY